jgi:hypothetical protein
VYAYEEKHLLTINQSNINLMSTPAITVSANGIVLHKDIESDLFNHDLKVSFTDDINEHLVDVFDTHVIPYVCTKEGEAIQYFFDINKFNVYLNDKYDNDDNLYY